jgi:glycosyltransferase involved in cell wall biosynthesis
VAGVERVSVLIPAWNAAAWVGDAIESAFAQTHPSLEVVVVDDGSTDETPEVLERYAGRLRWARIPHGGAAAARNRLLALAEGDWVQYLDADDFLYPEKIERQLVAATAKGADLVVSPFLSPSGKVQGRCGDTDLWLCLLRGRFGTTTSHLFRREALLQIGGWAVARRAAQEQELVGRILATKGRVVFHDEALSIKRRVNPNSLWRSIWRNDPKAAREADFSVVAEWVRHLRAEGELTVPRERAAGARFLRMAHSAWQRGAGGWDEVLAAAESVGLAPEALLSQSAPLYRAVYRRMGFETAQRWAQIAGDARGRSDRWARARRKDIARWARTSRSVAGAARRRLIGREGS